MPGAFRLGERQSLGVHKWRRFLGWLIVIVGFCTPQGHAQETAVQPGWKSAKVMDLSRHTVSLSQPVLVARNTGRLWFPTLIPLGAGRLGAVLNLDIDTPLQHPKAQYVWSKDGGWSWGDPVIAEHAEVVVHLADGDRLLLPFVLQSHPQGLTGRLQRIPRGEQKIIAEKEGEMVISGFPRPPKSIDMQDGSYSFGFNGQSVTRKDGGYLATIYGRYVGDTNYHLLAVSSPDGRRWSYQSTIATPSVIPRGSGGEGPCESALCRLKDGRLMCIFRISSGLTYGQVWSDDDGQTWTKPGRTDIGDETLTMKDASLRSVQPSAAVLPSGVIVLSGGRPGVSAWIDERGDGAEWTRIDLSAHHNAQVPDEPHVTTDGDATKHSTTGYTEVVVLDDQNLLVIYDRLRGGWDNLSADPKQTNSVWGVRMSLRERK